MKSSHPLAEYSPRHTPAGSDSCWDPQMGPDYCENVTADPVVRIKNDGLHDSPGRTVGKPKKNSHRNTLDFRDPTDGLIKRAEGTIEMKALYQIFRDPSVVTIETQYGPCPYIDEHGKQRWTFWDARITYDDGFRQLLAVKPAAIAAKTDYRATVERMFSQMPAGIADAVAVITDRDIPHWAVANGRLIHSVLNDGSWIFAKEMAKAARDMTAPISMREFCRPHSGIGRSFRTAVYLIAKCVLDAEPGLICADTLVEPHERLDVSTVFGSRDECELMAQLAGLRLLGAAGSDDA